MITNHWRKTTTLVSAATGLPVAKCLRVARNRFTTPALLALLSLLAAPAAHADGPGQPCEASGKSGCFHTVSTGPLAMDEQHFSDKLHQVVERVADRFLEDLIPEFPNRNPYLKHVYSLDLGLEALLELSEVTGEEKWKDLVLKIINQRGITPSTLLPYQSQPFATINFALFKATGDYAWLPVFVRESEIWRKEVRRSPEGAVLMYSRGNTDLYFLVVDHIQEYASRMARCGKHTGDITYYVEAAESAEDRCGSSTLCSPPAPSAEPLGSPASRSDCATYREQIQEKLELGLTAKRIHQDLFDEFGFEGNRVSQPRVPSSKSSSIQKPQSSGLPESAGNPNHEHLHLLIIRLKVRRIVSVRGTAPYLSGRWLGKLADKKLDFS